MKRQAKTEFDALPFVLAALLVAATLAAGVPAA